jgi:hypothetical protein
VRFVGSRIRGVHRRPQLQREMKPRTGTAALGARLACTTGSVVLALLLMIASGTTVSAAGVITVRRATYGGNCGTLRDGATDDTVRIAAECNSKERCTYRVDRSKMSGGSDRKPQCAKSYVVVYACSHEEKKHRVTLQKAEANEHSIDLNCGD